ncbi:thiamine phosphate synthase [Nitrosomonas supralitoralis]|uniref:Thiamine-phosphate synthase n=2 Tax=Nitrosomonas supralitoralis TaxID=2116706 RepID=A0A2P7NZ31_9PROT|nr:thiamine phosphate synthase [Nitrosomonas supralitoralis]
MSMRPLRNLRIRGLYAITPDSQNTNDLLDGTQQALTGGAQVIQYRNKSADKVLRKEQAGLLLQLCRQHEIPLIINDHIELAIEIGADGVHVGRDDISISTARKLLPPGKIIGASCYNNLESALEAEKQGADYVAFGAFYPSTTKPDAIPVSINLVNQARQIITKPIVGIGGIRLINAAVVIQNGCDAIAVCGDLFQAENIKVRAAQYARLFAGKL